MNPTTITCGDLAALGGPFDRLHQHDPARMVWGEDAVCFCHDGGPIPEDPVACREVLRVPVAGSYVVKLCCLCQREFRVALAGVPDEELRDWLAGQCLEVVEWRRVRPWWQRAGRWLGSHAGLTG